MKTLKERRLELGWTQLELCLKAKVGYSTYAKVEAGNRHASAAIVRKLAKFYNLSPKTILQSSDASMGSRND